MAILEGIIVSLMKKDAVKNLIQGLMYANKSRRFTRRGVHKEVCLACAKNEKVRCSLGVSLEDLLSIIELQPYGPMLSIVDEAVHELLSEGKLSMSKINVYDKQGEMYFLNPEIKETKISLPFELGELKIPSYVAVERRIIHAKEHILNNLINRNYRWNIPWNLRFAYSIYRQAQLAKGLLDEQQTLALIDIIYKIDQLFSFPHLPWEITYRGEPYVPSLEEFKNQLLKILHIQSTSGNEREVAKTLAEVARSNGLHAEVDENNNLYVVQEGKNPEKIMLICHLDTVSGIFTPLIKDGVVYGRGAVDNKGACVAALNALIMLAQNHIKPDFSVVLLGASSEETADRSKRGIIKAIKNRKHLFSTTVLSIIGEATGQTSDEIPQINYSLGERVRWTGHIPIGCKITTPAGEVDTGTHVAHVEDEVAWIEGRERESLISWIRLPDIRRLTRRALVEIEEIEKTLPETELGKTTITFKEEWEPSDLNQTPPRGVIHLDIRLPRDSYKELIKREMMRILRKWLLPPFYIEENWNENCGKVLDYTKSMAGSDIRRIEKELLPFFRALGMRRTSYRFGTDAKYILELTETPVIGLGPGDEHLAHRADEQVTVFELIRASLLYFALIQVCRCDKVSNRCRIILASRSRIRYIS